MDNQNFHQFKESKKKFLAIFVVILSIFFIALTVSTIVSVFNKIKEGRYIGQDIESRNTMSVTDTGEIYAQPDLALIDFSVVTEAETVEQAMSQNAEKMNNVINSIKEQGIEDKDLKTTSFSIYPRYEYRKIETQIYPYPPGKRVLVGYEVRQKLEVKIRDLAKIGQIIERATTAGANQVGDLQLTIDKQDELKKQARVQAIVKAKAKAEELATQLDVKLVRITNFTESSYLPMFYSLEKAAMAEGIGGGEVPQIETGESKITVTVTITYEIN